MKTDLNTLENKAKFFAQYYLQKVLRNYGWSNDVESILLNFISPLSWYLELKPLSQISDEDAKFLEYKNNKNFNKVNLDVFDLVISEIDYLRFNGYALPWNGISVEEMIEWKWIKLKYENKTNRISRL